MLFIYSLNMALVNNHGQVLKFCAEFGESEAIVLMIKAVRDVSTFTILSNEYSKIRDF